MPTESLYKRFIVWEDYGCYEGWDIILQTDNYQEAIDKKKDSEVNAKSYIGEVIITEFKQ
jgi:hypothetical protein